MMQHQKQFEQILECIINGSHQEAEDIFHTVVVEKSRRIYNTHQMKEMDLGGDPREDFLTDIENDQDEIESEELYQDSSLDCDEEVFEEDEEEVDLDVEDDMDFDMEDDSVVDMEELDDDEEVIDLDNEDDYNMDDEDVDMETDLEDQVEEVEDRVSDLEALMAELTADFEADLDADDEFEMDADLDMEDDGLDEFEADDDEDETEELEESAESDYVNKSVKVKKPEPGKTDNVLAKPTNKHNLGGKAVDFVKGASDGKNKVSKPPVTKLTKDNKDVDLDNKESLPKKAPSKGAKGPISGARGK